MNATITRFEYVLLKRQALVGIDWEIGNAIGVPDNPEAVEHVKLMEEAKRKIKAIKPRYRKTKKPAPAKINRGGRRGPSGEQR